MNWTFVYQQPMPNQMNNFNPMCFNNMFDQNLFIAAQNNPQQMMDFNTSNQLNSLEDDQKYKINITFSSMQGTKINMIFDCDESIDGILTKFLKRVNLTELIGNLQNKIKFILNADPIDFGDDRKLKDVLVPGTTNTNIIIHDTGNLIGA